MRACEYGAGTAPSKCHLATTSYLASPKGKCEDVFCTADGCSTFEVDGFTANDESRCVQAGRQEDARAQVVEYEHRFSCPTSRRSACFSGPSSCAQHCQRDSRQQGLSPAAPISTSCALICQACQAAAQEDAPAEGECEGGVHEGALVSNVWRESCHIVSCRRLCGMILARKSGQPLCTSRMGDPTPIAARGVLRHGLWQGCMGALMQGLYL